MECPVCESPWNSEQKIPRILSCGHSICESCAKVSFKSCKIDCQSCKKSHTFNLERQFDLTDEQYALKCINTMSKNFTLLSLITSTSPQRNSIKDIDLFEIQLCEDHNLPLHSYTERPYSELCDRCIEEIAEYELVIKPIPEVSEYFSNILQEILKKLQEQKEECELALASFGDSERSEAQRAEEMVKEHFGIYFTCLEQVRANMFEILTRAIADQNTSNEKLLQALEARKDLVVYLEARCSYLEKLSDKDLVRHSQSFESLFDSANIPNDPLEFYTVILNHNKAKTASIPSLLDSSYEFSLKKQTNMWLCDKCRNKTADGLFICGKCGCFRSISSYPNIINNPTAVTEQEINEINSRRQYELQIISELDKNDVNSAFFLIHANWITKWKEFVFNKNNSAGRLIGVLPPGPITNNLLFDDSDCTVLRQKLKAAMDYRGLNQKVWEAYYKIYGGGPVIMRKKLNIYDDRQNK